MGCLLIAEEDDLAPPNALGHPLDVVRRGSREGRAVPLRDGDGLALEMADAPIVVPVLSGFTALDPNFFANDLVSGFFAEHFAHLLIK